MKNLFVRNTKDKIQEQPKVSEMPSEKARAEKLAENLKKARENGNLCCEGCGYPTGVYSLTIRVVRDKEGKKHYLCQNCYGRQA